MGNQKACLTFIFDSPKVIAEFPLSSVGSQKDYYDKGLTDRNFENYLSKYALAVIDVLRASSLPVQLCFSADFVIQLKPHQKAFADFEELVNRESTEIILKGSSLSFLYSNDIWLKEIQHDLQILDDMLNIKPKGFCSPENIFFNEMGKILNKSGFKYVFAGAIDWYLGHNYNERIFNTIPSGSLKLCLVDPEQHANNFKFGDQKIAFVHIDYEIFTRHADIDSLMKIISTGMNLTKIMSALREGKNVSYNIKQPVSGSLHGIQLSSFKGNNLQATAIKRYYELGAVVSKNDNTSLFHDWMQLGSAIFFLNMGKSENGARYYNNYMLILSDLELKIN